MQNVTISSIQFQSVKPQITEDNTIVEISGKRSIRSIQQDFQASFPFLKIAFYDSQNIAGEGSPPTHSFENLSKTIEELGCKQSENKLQITGESKVKALEKQFYEYYGLSVQVLCRSGATWMQLTSNKDWALSEQNNEMAKYEEKWKR